MIEKYKFTASSTAFHSFHLCCCVLMLVTLIPLPSSAEDIVRPERAAVDIAESHSGIVVSDTDIASQIGADILAQGGNAVDAAVAVAFALAVTWPEAGNISGGGFMMVAPPNEEVVCVEYRETAPACVDEHSFEKWQERHHAQMAGVPGTLRGLELAHKKYGSLPWDQLVKPSIRIAREGIVVDEYLAYSLNRVLTLSSIKNEKRFAEFRRLYGKANGELWQAGDLLKQPDLAITLEIIAEQGADAFYTGGIAKKIVAEMEEQGGLITAEDLKNYKANIRPAVSGQVNGYTLYGAYPPSSGGITVLLQMRMAEAVGLEMDPENYWNADQVHLLAEISKRAFRDRAAYLADPDFSSIPEFMFSNQYAQKQAEKISRNQATSSIEVAGEIPISNLPEESLETTHFSIIDRNGMAVSNTYTLEGTFGCRIAPKGTGFVLNNEMGDFNWIPGYTNQQGRIGTKPNLMNPGKRMLSSQSPMIVRKDGEVALIIGSPGGRTIINTVTQILVQTLLFDRPLVEAIDGPRFHHQWFPDEIKFESDDQEQLTRLTRSLIDRGHTISRPKGWLQGSAHGIEYDPLTRTAVGVADWRRGGKAVAVPQIVPLKEKAVTNDSQ
ncbi:gamma-glutamyltransferase [Rubinisphaera sp.]|uniref:gamma-glutamyltransferase n=1 Tax=Rubinisphaera sp. TaxID=2024857 RepID=UPI000C0FFF25|nr:gamma-glutamyltransferase [Rubinisphaera sp.]MBV11803.1 gamma-glutamyltransferase [Rubinisphaera sp.]HCS51147.1 gamma-glutamyltransferase [Planctomycetaceae bacterium]|tara:strand:- start:2784 stop:4613 length:1830 start_codon:yes stop_codon:yes gene_type:complete